MKRIRKIAIFLVLLVLVGIPGPVFADNALQWYERGLAYSAKKDYNSAISAFGEAVKQDPQFLRAYLNRGVCYIYVREFDLAIADLSKAAEIDPVMEDIYFVRAQVYKLKGAIQPAIEDFTKAIQINEKKPFAYAERGNLYAGTGQLDLAIQDYTKAIKYERGNEKYYFARGLVYAKRAEYDSALQNFNTALALKPMFVLGYLHRGVLYGLMKDDESALADFNKALELEPDNADAYLFRGNLLRYHGKQRAAIMDYQKAILYHHRQLYWVYYYKGLSCEMIGRSADSFHDYQEALKYAPPNDPSFPIDDVKQRIKSLQVLYGSGDRAEIKVKSWIEKEAPVSPHEKIITKVFIGIFDAYKKGDFAQFATFYAIPTNINLFEKMAQTTKDHKLHAVEVFAYSDKTVKGRITYSFQALDTSHLGQTIVLGQADVLLELMNNRWRLVEMREYSASYDMLESIVVTSEVMEKAKKRYGTDALTEWQELK